MQPRGSQEYDSMQSAAARTAKHTSTTSTSSNKGAAPLLHHQRSSASLHRAPSTIKLQGIARKIMIEVCLQLNGCGSSDLSVKVSEGAPDLLRD